MQGTLKGKSARQRGAFTLLEMLVSITVLTLLILIVTRLINSATILTTVGHQHLDADNQARPVLDRMAEDFSQIVKRPDVDYLLKQPSNPQTGSGNTGKNDQIAFFTHVDGYYGSASHSHYSVVGYRLNSDSSVTTASLNKLERLGKALPWNGDASANMPIAFVPVPLASPFASPKPSPLPLPNPTPAWPQAGNMAADPDGHYEVIGPQIFRFEYFYQLAQGDLSDKPWDDINQANNTVNGLHDVGAIVVTIATIDPKSRVLVSDAQLVTLAGQMNDYIHYNSPGNSGKVGPALTEIWQDAINASTLPKAVLAGIRVYERYFYLNGLQQ